MYFINYSYSVTHLIDNSLRCVVVWTRPNNRCKEAKKKPNRRASDASVVPWLVCRKYRTSGASAAE